MCSAPSRRMLAPFAAAFVAACQTPTPAPPPPPVNDPHSFAVPREVQVRHLDLDLELDFDARRVRGSARLRFVRRDPTAPLLLDTAGLEIRGVFGEDGSARRFRLGPPDPVLGRELWIDLAARDETVRVDYETSPDAAALQWLTPEQTAAGAAPFLYTQGQAILTRSWIPLQDTPGVRVTYEARVRAPRELQVVMAAPESAREADGAYRFRMPRPIPSYLIALACGRLEHAPIGERCGVWAEPTVVADAAREFEDMDDMLAACERLFGPYRWGRYEVLVLPAAFPFGGMENPTLTFATPTILAGDKSLVSLVAHELAHSWSGNLVTNATWSDFWLNEGFTVYLEQRIMEALYGEERAAMEILLGLQGLEKELAKLPPSDQVLHVDLRGRNPDDGMTAVPYDKGAAFLRVLEHAFGRERFDAFLAEYFEHFAFRSITTAEFLEFLRAHLLRGDPGLEERLRLREWIFEPGLPDNVVRPACRAFERTDAELARFLAGTPAADLDVGGWVTHQWLRFLDGLPDDLPAERLAELDAAFGLTSTRNAEIASAWLARCIRHGYEPAMARVEEFLLGVGRRKLVRPLYEALARTPAGKERARAIYARARPRYHAITVRTIDRILEWRRTP